MQKGKEGQAPAHGSLGLGARWGSGCVGTEPLVTLCAAGCAERVT